MRKPTIDWEAYREQLCSLRYEQKKSLTDINKILFEQLGRCVTNARLSQVFTGWKNEPEDPGGFQFRLQGDNVNAN